MKFDFTPDLERELKKIAKTDPKLSKRILKQLKLFEENPKHPSLRVHKLAGEVSSRWSISITYSLRMIYILEEDVAYFIAIGTHDQVYGT